MVFIKRCLKNKGDGMKMKHNMIGRCVKICFQTCLIDSLILMFVTLLLGILPLFSILVYNEMIAKISTYSGEMNQIALSIVFYCIIVFVQNSVYNLYHHYYLNFHSLLHFEKKIRADFYKRCNGFRLQEYLLPEMVNGTKRAQFASINIFRVYQIVVEIGVAIVGIVGIMGIIITIETRLLFFLCFSILPPIFDTMYQVLQRKHLLYQNTQSQKEAEEYVKFLTQPEHRKEIDVMDSFSFLLSKWKEAKECFILREKNVLKKQVVVSSLFQVLQLIGKIGAYASTTILFINSQITLAQYSVTIYTFTQITTQSQNLFSLFGHLTDFSVMVEPYFRFVDKEVADLQLEKETNDDIEFKLSNISYTYPEAKEPALKNINLTIKKGSFVSIVGSNGSGKTTLSKILLGFLSPTGTLCVNKKENSSYLKDKSYIPQQFHCFAVSIKDNIQLGQEVEDKKIEDGLVQIGLEELVELKNERYGLEFGGMELSGGQKQRLAILRGILKESSVLVLDEPTSAIDPLQESEIYRLLLEVFQGKTVVMVSHRLSLTQKSDVIVVLEDGEVKEIGNHSQLMKLQGEYANMWSRQAEVYQ